MFKLTGTGLKKVKQYIKELEAMRKEILDAGKDTADETTLPWIEDIELDVDSIGIDGEDYYNCWAVTDHYDGGVLHLEVAKDFIEVRDYNEEAMRVF